ncbi:MAG: molybdopterin-dependent oxidoreductase [Alphaproteobacteria bacterium]|nr:molybdopterin-dependent oxidoreductase [Alphaproteobacteria bacterium]
MAANTTLTVNRRRFLTSAAGFAFVVGAAGLRPSATVAGSVADAEAHLNIWVSIGADNLIRIVYPATDLGQGSSTALPMILAEELDADWTQVRVDQLDVDDRRYGNPKFGMVLYTAGSSAVQGYYMPLRLAGAQARRTLIRAAAAHWSAPEERLRTEPNVVVDPESGRRLTYGQIAGLTELAAVPIPEASESLLKSRSEFRLIGADLPRIDIPAKTRGAFEYGADVRVPDMIYATVVRAPVEGETPVTVMDRDTLAIPRVLGTVMLPDGVAILAETQEAALFGKSALSVEWTDTAASRAHNSDQDLMDYTSEAEDLAKDGAIWRETGDALAAVNAAPRRVERLYLSDYAYHAQFEPMGAVASVTENGQRAEVWIASQTQSWSLRTVTETLGIPADRVRMHMTPMGGSFGRRTELMQPYLRDAVLASKAAGRPVKVLWTREDDVKFGAFRPAAAQKMIAGLTADGALSGWRHRVAAPSVIAYFNPLRWAQVAPQDVITMRGAESKFYDLGDMRAEHVITERRARLAPWRGIGAAYTSFASEAFMDELAEEAGADPVAFRMALLNENARGRWLIERALEMAEWERPRSETALGLAFAGYGDSMAAGVAEISLDRESGVIAVKRFWATVDAGLIISPNNALAQIEGGVVYGVSSALKERITIKDGEVEQSNFFDYEILRIDETPEIEVDIANVDGPPTSIGEVSTPIVAPAIANAFFALTGRRLRHMPFTPDRVLEALA